MAGAGSPHALEKVGGPILNPAVLLFGDNRAMEFVPPDIPGRLVGGIRTLSVRRRFGI